MSRDLIRAKDFFAARRRVCGVLNAASVAGAASFALLIVLRLASGDSYSPGLVILDLVAALCLLAASAAFAVLYVGALKLDRAAQRAVLRALLTDPPWYTLLLGLMGVNFALLAVLGD